MVVGFTAPYVLADGLMFATALKPEQVLPFATLLGAVLAAWLQAWSLGASRRSMVHWVFRHALAWLVTYAYTMGLLWASNAWKASLPGAIPIVMAFGSLLTGGLILGALTYGSLLRLVTHAQDHRRM
jgi:hypothetical protein